MKKIPILFSVLMVKQIVAGNKNMTRRAVKGTALAWLSDFTPEYVAGPGNEKLCPYGGIGDILWIREEHYRYGHWVKDGQTKKGAQKWKFVAADNEVLYYDNAPSSFKVSRDKDAPELNFWYKRLAHFMPKALSRYELEVTGKKIERVQAISAEDAISEGIEKEWDGSHHWFRNYLRDDVKDEGHMMKGAPKASFESLWKKINGAETWEANQWVWCISFKLNKKS